MGYFQNLFKEMKKVKLLKEATDASRNGYVEKSIEAFTKLIEMYDETMFNYSHEELAQFYEFRGHEFNKIKNYERALKDMNSAIEKNPLNDKALAKRGFLLCTYYDSIEEGYDAIYKALKINPENSIANRVLQRLEK